MLFPFLAYLNSIFPCFSSSIDIERFSSAPFLPLSAAVGSPLIVGLLNDYGVIDDISNSLSGSVGGDFSNCSQSGAGTVSVSRLVSRSVHLRGRQNIPSPARRTLSQFLMQQ